jgi:serine/threonine protein kinase
VLFAFFAIGNMSTLDVDEFLPRYSWGSLKFGKLLGKGSFGKVHAATLGNKQVAVKELEGAPFPDYLVRKFEKEAKIMWNVGNECTNVVRLYGVCTDEPEHPCLVMEHMSGGALTHYLHNPTKVISDVKKWQLGLEISEGLSSVHNTVFKGKDGKDHKGVVHGDLKSNNILLKPHNPPSLDPDGVFHAKIADFGLAKVDVLCCAV